jgi:site-specific DNA-methyltransferase (adenine-specific)
VKPYYQDSACTIYHGDAREVLQDIEPVDLLLTDPPYGLKAARKEGFGSGVKRHMNGLVKGGCIPKRDYGDAVWDDTPVEFSLLQAYIKASRFQIIWGGNYFPLPPTRCILVWDKLRGDTDYADGELAWTNLDDSLRIKRYKWNGFLTEKPETRFHPTQKPLDVMTWAISLAPESCQTIIDPFMGSGTTLRAAKDLGRKAIGIELEERYCEIAAQRLSQEVLQLT